MASTSVADRLRLEKGQHELKLGKSFGKDSKSSFHTIRYDFKPASVDTNEESSVVIGEDGSVEVTVPHVPGAGTSHTVYRGNKRPLQKECVLIINHETGEICLEKLSYAINLKKTRLEPNARIAINQRPVTPIDKSKNSPVQRAPTKPPPTSSTAALLSRQRSPANSSSPDAIFGAAQELGTIEQDMEMSSSSSSSSSDSSSDSGDSEDDDAASTNQPGSSYQREKAPDNPGPTNFLHTLSRDLRLSESSDDDSD